MDKSGEECKHVEMLMDLFFYFPCDVYLRFFPPCSTCVFESRLSVWRKNKKNKLGCVLFFPLFLNRRNIMFSYGDLSVDIQLSTDSISLFIFALSHGLLKSAALAEPGNMCFLK